MYSFLEMNAQERYTAKLTELSLHGNEKRIEHAGEPHDVPAA